MGRFFPYADKEDIIRNFKSSDNASYNGYFIYPKGGAIEYINSVASRLDNSKNSLRRRNKGYKIIRTSCSLC